jgi:hypothetical protein
MKLHPKSSLLGVSYSLYSSSFAFLRLAIATTTPNGPSDSAQPFLRTDRHPPAPANPRFSEISLYLLSIGLNVTQFRILET